MEFLKHFTKYGRFRQITNLPVRQVLSFVNFVGGYVVADSRTDIPREASPYAPNMEYSKQDRLIRAPGTTGIESFPVREPGRMEVHMSLDFTAELLLFDPPYLGVRQYGNTVWTDHGLFGGHIAGVNFGGSFLFTDGMKVYAREKEATTLEIVEQAPVAFTYTSFAGRVWAGHTIIEGRLEPLGIRWSDPDSDYENWNYLNFELLIDEQVSGGKIQSMNPLGLDVMAVVLRSALWTGRRTGLPDRPADFRLAVPGVGAINGPVCKTTKQGVAFLSDDGVQLFDGNTAVKISKAIDALLIIDYNNIDAYRSAYNPYTNRYFLYTPTDTWIYEFNEQRWMHRTMVVRDSVIMPIQIPGVRWNNWEGEWSDQTMPWYMLAATSAASIDMIFLAESPVTGEIAIEKEDYEATTYFGEEYVSVWESAASREQKFNHIVTIDGVNLEYVGGGYIEIWTPNIDGDYELLFARTLPTVTKPRVFSYPIQKTGLAMGVQVRFGTAPIL